MMMDLRDPTSHFHFAGIWTLCELDLDAVNDTWQEQIRKGIAAYYYDKRNDLLKVHYDRGVFLYSLMTSTGCLGLLSVGKGYHRS